MTKFLMPSKKLTEFFGTVLGVFGVGFVAVKAVEYYDELGSSLSFTTFQVVALFLLTLAFFALNLFLAFGWYKICIAGKLEINFLSALQIYAKSQLAKYVPGNIFQFLGRQALMSAKDYRNKDVARTTFLELSILAVAGSLFFLPLAAMLLFSFSTILTVLFFAGLVLSFLAVLKAVSNMNWVWSFLSYFTFLLGTGFIFVLTIYVFAGQALTSQKFVLITVSYVVAWLLGLLTPGAPAGLGIREAVLLFLLKDIMPESALLLSILISRFINVLADILFYAAGYTLSFLTPLKEEA